MWKRYLSVIYTKIAMKKHAYFLSIPQPCGQQWSEMQTSATGRHCKSCSKEVIDFTAFTDRQLMEYMNVARGEVCGHLSLRQLNRVYMPAPEIRRHSGRSLPALVLVAATLSVNATFGQTEPVTTTLTSTPLPIPVGKVPETTPVRTVSGKVVAADNQEGVSFATIKLIMNDSTLPEQIVITDTDGKFSFSDKAGTVVALEVSADTEGFISQRIALQPGNQESMIIRMEYDVQIEGAMLWIPADTAPVKQQKRRRK